MEYRYVLMLQICMHRCAHSYSRERELLGYFTDIRERMVVVVVGNR